MGDEVQDSPAFNTRQRTRGHKTEAGQQKEDKVLLRNRFTAKNTKMNDRERRAHNETVLQSLQPGDLVMFYRTMFINFIHWAVYIGNGEVVHVTGDRKTAIGSCCAFKEKGEIRKDDFWKVTKDSLTKKGNQWDNIYRPHPPEQITSDALNQLGPIKYNLWKENCEHFANRCRYGKKTSFQAYLLKEVCSRLSIIFSISTLKFALCVFLPLVPVFVISRVMRDSNSLYNGLTLTTTLFFIWLYYLAAPNSRFSNMLRDKEEKYIFSLGALCVAILLVIRSDGFLTTWARLVGAAIPLIHAVVSAFAIVSNLLEKNSSYWPGLGQKMVTLTDVVKNIGSFIVSFKTIIGFTLCYLTYYLVAHFLAIEYSGEDIGMSTRHDVVRFGHMMKIQLVTGGVLSLFTVLLKVGESWILSDSLMLSSAEVNMRMFTELLNGEVAPYRDVGLIKFAMGLFLFGLLFVVLEFIMASYNVFI